MTLDPDSTGEVSDLPSADAFKQLCPSRRILERLGERWAMLLLVRLESGPMRFGELRREIEGVSQKMLTQTLRRLERDGYIQRHKISDRPIAVEYELTERAREIVPIVASLKRWAEDNWQAVHDSNVAFDARHA
jgi:DNA-binding HxlR family transcriptional regulator